MYIYVCMYFSIYPVSAIIAKSSKLFTILIKALQRVLSNNLLHAVTDSTLTSYIAGLGKIISFILTT